VHQIEISQENRLLALSGQVGVDVKGRIVNGVED